MHLHHALPLVLIAAAAAQNDILYYKFEGGGTKALNYASNSPAPAEGPIVNSLTTAPTSPYVPGRFGSALNSGIPSPLQSNAVDTGWAPAVTGDYSWAMWMRNTRGTPGPSLTYVAGIPVSGAFRIYSGSSILLTVGGAGGTSYYRTVANVYQMATAGWVHVAFVVDATASTATYYVNGVPEAPLTLTGAPNITGSTFMIGRQLPTLAPSIYDIDEFRFMTRVATPAEIAIWSTMNTAGDSAFGQGCDATMTSSNGPPALGNFLYTIDMSTVAGGVGFMNLGLSRTMLGALPLPADVGAIFPSMAGCTWECSDEALLVVPITGTASVGLPIPPNPAFDGFELYGQALFIGGPRQYMTTNPLAIAVGN